MRIGCKKKNLSQNVTGYILDLNEQMKRCQELAFKRMSECQKIKCKSWYDKNAIMRKFNVRYLMLVLEISKQHKMSEQWLGPGKVYKGKQTNFNLVVVVVVTCY